MTAITSSPNLRAARSHRRQGEDAAASLVVTRDDAFALSPIERSMPMVPALATATTRSEDMEDWLTRFAAYLDSTRRLAPRSVDTYVKYCRIAFLGMPHVAGWRGEIDAGSLTTFLAAETARGMQASSLRTQMFSLTAYYRYLDRCGVPHLSPLDDVKPPRPIQSDREFYTEKDADAIVGLAMASTDRDDRLGGIVLSTFSHTGLRLTELVGLRTDQLDLDLRRLRVLGKGQMKRTVPISASLAATLDEYLTNVRPTLRGARSPYLFVNPRSERRGSNAGKYGEKTINRITKRLGEAAGVTGRHHPHKWRHTYATRLLRNGVDIHMIQRLLGHSDIKTTVVYLHLVDDDLGAAVDSVFS